MSIYSVDNVPCHFDFGHCWFLLSYSGMDWPSLLDLPIEGLPAMKCHLLNTGHGYRVMNWID